jgi:MFS transporter, DHA2 family, multidrug resistance protein
MMPAILLRGLGLGFLFLSITLIAFSDLNDRNLASGIGLFNAGRQLGGLMGVAGLQTIIDHDVECAPRTGQIGRLAIDRGRAF